MSGWTESEIWFAVGAFVMVAALMVLAVMALV
jgi:hypothetical protein